MMEITVGLWTLESYAAKRGISLDHAQKEGFVLWSTGFWAWVAMSEDHHAIFCPGPQMLRLQGIEATSVALLRRTEGTSVSEDS